MNNYLTETETIKEVPLIILCDDATFTAKSLHNFLWVTFTRCNPSHDIYGIKVFIIINTGAVMDH